LKPFADYSNTVITIASLISLFVCLIRRQQTVFYKTVQINARCRVEVSGLTITDRNCTSPGMDRALRANVITKSGKAVETAGDIDTLLLDKTGTISEAMVMTVLL